MAVAVVSIVVATGLLGSGCDRGRAANTNPSPKNTAPSNAPQSEATVELSPSQLNAIKIEPVGTHLFPIEKEAVGSIQFDEDPSIIQAESILIGAAATFELTNNELSRVKALGETNGIAQKELEQAISDKQTAEAALKAARDAVRALGKTDAEIDQMVAAGKIGSAPDMRSPTRWGVANVVESDSPLFRIGQPIQVKVMAYPDRVFEGKVSKIYATVDPNTHRQTIRSEIADPKNELRSGMLANFVIRIQDPVKATAILVNAVIREGDGTMTTWVTTDRRHFLQRKVKLGLQKDGYYQIVEGLKSGELAVTEGGVFLSNMVEAPPTD